MRCAGDLRGGGLDPDREDRRLVAQLSRLGFAATLQPIADAA